MLYSTYIYLALVLVLMQSLHVSASSGHLHRRSILQMHGQLDCLKNNCHPLKYVGYGCYCGVGGAGQPVDGIDRCCRKHDRCYDEVNNRCNMAHIYNYKYTWTCLNKRPLCHISRTYHHTDDCAQQLCKCDEDFAMCLQRYPCPKKYAACVTSPERIGIMNQLRMLFHALHQSKK